MRGCYIVLFFQGCGVHEPSLIYLSGLDFCALLVWLGRIVSLIIFPSMYMHLCSKLFVILSIVSEDAAIPHVDCISYCIICFEKVVWTAF